MITNIEEEELQDILDTLVFEDEPYVLTDECVHDIIETSLHLMEEYMQQHPNSISDPAFYETMLEEIQEFFYVQMEDHFMENDVLEEDVNEIIEVAFDLYISTFQVERSNAESIHSEQKGLAAKIHRLRELPQPTQRTPEWYQFRWNLITASNAWKAFGTQSAINQLIYEKCQPLKEASSEGENEIVLVNTNTTLHWGQKYEPLSVLIYEDMYQSTVEDFGCIQHPVYRFIGASPDGVVTQSSTGRYGRMLEIKNVVNREITGIPKQEYWIQMQLQMEVCDLDECDFLETKFIEYPDYASYQEDACDGTYKGVIMYFHTKEGRPHYEYMPLSICEEEEVAQWEEKTMYTYEHRENPLLFIKFIYWKLEKISCVLVKRNREWFQNNVKQLEKIWKIIEQERVTGYEHRAPVKKNRPYKETVPAEEVCFLKVVKL